MDVLKQYRKERKRIQSYMSKLRKKGYEVYYKLPSIPKKVTEGSVRRLKKITAKTLKSKSRLVAKPSNNEDKELQMKDLVAQAIKQQQSENEEKYKRIKEAQKRQKIEEQKNIRNAQERAKSEAPSLAHATVLGLKAYLSGYPVKVAKYCIGLINSLVAAVGIDNVAKAVATLGEAAYRVLSGIMGQSDDDMQAWSDALIAALPIDDEAKQKAMDLLEDETA